MNKTVLCLFMCLNMAALCRCSHVRYKSRVITLNVVSSDCNTPVNDVTIKCPTGESLRMRSTGLGNYQILTKKFPIKLELSKLGFMTQTLIVRSKMTMVQLRCVGAVCTANTVRISVSSSCSKAVTNVKIESQNEQIKALTSSSPGIYDVSVCLLPVTLSFQKSGLVGQTKIFAGTTGNVELLCKAAPLLLEHVQSKVRSLGDDVKFCCWADKIPELTFDPFIWFFNGNPIPGEEAMQLEMTNIEASNAGLYSCKASITVDGVTEAVVSEGASLTLVGDENDFSGDLLSNILTILEGPPVCVFDAQLCNPRPCQTNPAGSQECKDDGYVCPDQIDFVPHTCPSGVILPLPRVMSCKCCPRPNVEYKGTVRDPDGTVLSGIKLTIKDHPGTPTEITSNAAGMFFGSAIPEIRRLVIHASDSTGTFLPTTKVVDVPPGVIGPIEEINVVMFPLASPVAIDARVGSNLSLSDMPLTPGAGLGSVIIPGGVLFNMDGTPYNGIANVHLTVLSPADLNAIDNAPGEFAVLTDEGKRRLVTGGVFNIKVTGQNGMNLISMPITVTGATGMHLFDLDIITGLWRTSPGSTTTTRRKRSSHIQGIGDLDNLGAVWYNIDKFMEATDNKECWIKMKVFDAAAPNTELQAGVEFKPYILQYTDEDPPNAIKPGALDYVNPINDKCYRVACDLDPDNNPSTFLVLGMTTKFSVDGFDVPKLSTAVQAADHPNTNALIGQGYSVLANGRASIKAEIKPSVPFYAGEDECVAASIFFHFEANIPSLGEKNDPPTCYAKVRFEKDVSDNGFFDLIAGLKLVGLSMYADSKVCPFEADQMDEGVDFKAYCVQYRCTDADTTTTLTVSFLNGVLEMPLVFCDPITPLTVPGANTPNPGTGHHKFDDAIVALDSCKDDPNEALLVKCFRIPMPP